MAGHATVAETRPDRPRAAAHLGCRGGIDFPSVGDISSPVPATPNARGNHGQPRGLGVDVVIEWLVFVGVSLAVLVALRPLAHRLNRSVDDTGIGSRRLLGHAAVVLRDIPAGGDVGLVRVDREEWRAQSTDGSAIPTGTAVRVADVQGTRVIVAAVDQLSTSAPDELEQ